MYISLANLTFYLFLRMLVFLLFSLYRVQNPSRILHDYKHDIMYASPPYCVQIGTLKDKVHDVFSE